MQTTLQVTQTDLTRQERLRLWLWKQCLSQADIARQLDVSRPTVGSWIRAEQIPSWRVQMLRDLIGIPEELLPAAKDNPVALKPAQPAAQ